MNRKNILDLMLAVIGEGGVSSLATTHPSVITAESILTANDLEFQGRGWWFNTEYSLKLVADSNGRIAIPNNTLDCAMSDVSIMASADKGRYVRRGAFIYDALKHTNVLTVGYLYVDVVLQLDIEDLPTVAATYLMRKAAQDMHLDDDGDAQKQTDLGRQRGEAWQALKAKELTVLAVSAMDNQTSKLLTSRMNSGYSASNVNLIGGRVR